MTGVVAQTTTTPSHKPIPMKLSNNDCIFLNLAFLVEFRSGHDCLLHAIALAVIFDRRLESDFGLVVGMAPFVGRVGLTRA